MLRSCNRRKILTRQAWQFPKPFGSGGSIYIWKVKMKRAIYDALPSMGGGKGAKFGFSERCLRVPLYDPIVTNNSHWREIETTGLETASETMKKSFKFLLFGITSTALTLSLFHKYSDHDVDTSVEFIVNEKHHKYFDQIKFIVMSTLCGAFIFFNLDLFRRVSPPILKKLLTTKNQVFLSPLNWFVETNSLRLLLSLGLVQYITTPERFKHNIENYLLSGVLGGIIGTVFAGLVLSRTKIIMAHSGFLGVIGGLAGFINFKPLLSYYDTDQAYLMNSHVAQSSNRKELVSIPTRAIPYLLLSFAYFGFVAGFFVPGALQIWLSATAGGLTGGYCTLLIDQNRVYFREQGNYIKDSVQNLFYDKINDS